MNTSSCITEQGEMEETEEEEENKGKKRGKKKYGIPSYTYTCTCNIIYNHEGKTKGISFIYINVSFDFFSQHYFISLEFSIYNIRVRVESLDLVYPIQHDHSCCK